VNRPNPPPAAPLLDLMLRQRVVIAAALGGLTALCWLYLFIAAADMRAMGDMDMPMPMAPKGAVDLVLLLAMWWVMMAGMMLPGAAPMILTFATVNRRRRARAQPYAPTALFAAGYLLAWAASAWPRRPAHGSQPRPLLPRLLLDPDGAAVRRRRDEPAVGRRPGRRGAD